MELPAMDRCFQYEAVTLEPLTLDGLRQLAPKLRVPDVFRGGHGGGIAALPASDEEYVTWFAGYAPWRRGGRTYQVRYHGELQGTTSLYGLDEAARTVGIGYTALAPAVWATAVNPTAKMLLMGWAFDEAALATVIFHADSENRRSRRALAKLGATLEEIIPRERQRADGTWRDTCAYAIHADEWPRVRYGLVTRIAHADDDSVS